MIVASYNRANIYSRFHVFIGSYDGAMKVICKLADLIAERGLDQKTLAEKTGLSPTTVGKLARGHFGRIDNQTVMTLCLYFGLQSIAELIEIEWEDGDIEGSKG